MRWLIFTIVLVLFGVDLQAQRPGGGQGGQRPQGEGSITGTVINLVTKMPVEYANVVIYKMRDSTMAGGAVTDENGLFEMKKVPYGMYKMKINFIGFDQTVIDRVMISPRKPEQTMKPIELKPANINLDEFEVVADKAPFEYKIDKKVVNVTQDLNSAGGTAADVLENTPSVEVDIEGNVSLRGSSNFTVLINNRPSVLEGSDALQQIPASTIENIEIITNPSAKYDPDGTAGIINVILKEEKENGLTGIFNLGIGTKDKYNADVLLNYKMKKISLFAGLDYRNDNFSSSRESERISYFTDTTMYLNSTSERFMRRGGISGKLGFDWYVGKNTTIGVSGKYGTFKFGFDGDGKNNEWMVPGERRLNYITESEMTRPRDYYNVNFNLMHRFDNKGHQLLGMIYWSDRWGSSDDYTLEWETDELWNPVSILNNINTREDEESDQFRIKFDYTKPFGENSRLEAGFQSRIETEHEDYLFEEYNDTTGWVVNDLFTSQMDYKRDIHSLYTTYAGEFAGIGYQFGLRGEYTLRSIKDQETATEYKIDRLDYFPSIHLSKQLTGENQLVLSYSRRIHRPRGRYLDPFLSYRDANTRWQGNPGLLPEYVDSYELGWLKKWNGTFLSVEGFYRMTQNKFTRLMIPMEGNLVLHTIDNLNKDHSLGTEFMINKEFGKKISLNLNGSLYYYSLEGEIEGDDVSKESTNWSTRLTTTYKFLQMSRIQLRLSYRGPSVTAQGTTEGTFMSDLAFRHDFLQRKASLTLQVRDIFGTSKRESTSETANFYDHSIMQRESQMVRLTLSYRLNNYKPEKQDRESRNGDMEDMEFEY